MKHILDNMSCPLNPKYCEGDMIVDRTVCTCGPDAPVPDFVEEREHRQQAALAKLDAIRRESLIQIQFVDKSLEAMFAQGKSCTTLYDDATEELLRLLDIVRHAKRIRGSM